MPSLSSGARAELSGRTLTVTSRLGDQLDLLALLVDGSRRAGSDDDLVFWNAPADRHGVRLVSAGTLQVVLARVPASVERIVFAASRDGQPFAELNDLTTQVVADTGETWTLQADQLSSQTVLVLGEFYRLRGTWRVSSVGAGYASGLAGFLRDHGVEVDEDDAPPPQPSPQDQSAHRPAPLLSPASPPSPLNSSSRRPGTSTPTSGGPPSPSPVPWPPAPASGPTAGPSPEHPLRPGLARLGQRGHCLHCGTRLPRKFLAWGRCPMCGPSREAWLRDLERLLVTSSSAALGQHWARLISMGFDPARMRDEVEPIALRHLATVVDVAFADSIIEQHEVDDFNGWVEGFSLRDHPKISTLRQRLAKGQELSQLRAGVLPAASADGLHLNPSEIAHLRSPVTFVKRNSSGERHHQGQLIVTSRGISFAGSSGHQYTFNQVLGVDVRRGAVCLLTTRSGGEYVYLTRDAEYTAAVAEGALRVAKRLVVSSSERDGRSIPQAVKIAVFQRDGGKCVQCGRSEYLEYDHVIPWSRGGASSEGNVQLLCRRCNLEKGARI